MPSALWSYFQVYIAPDYGTDEIAFDQYAAQLVLHGINPYLHSMAAAFPLFHVSPNGYTFLLSGKPVTNLSYPALSFEPYLPLLALGSVDPGSGLGGRRRAGPRAAPSSTPSCRGGWRRWRSWSISLDIYIGYAVGGITDFLFVPLLAGAAVGWDRFPFRKGWAAWRGPVLMGLAMAVKQTPWLVMPFVVAGIMIESHRVERTAAGDPRRNALLLHRARGVPRPEPAVRPLSPTAWVRGVLTPFSSQAVPAGQGLVSLSLSLPIGGGSLRAFTVATVVVFAAVLLSYVASYPVLKPAAFLIPSCVLFFAARSFGSYLVMLIPSAIVAAATVTRVPGAWRWRRWPWVVAGGAGAGGVAVAVALLSASPLTMSIASVRTTGQLATVERTEPDGHQQHCQGGSAGVHDRRRHHHDGVLAAGRRPAIAGPARAAEYTIQAPSYVAMPSISTASRCSRSQRIRRPSAGPAPISPPGGASC